MRRLAVMLATGFGIGRLPVAPATWASLAVACLLLALSAAVPRALDPLPLGVALLVVTALAVWASGEAERELGHDAHPIVVDEAAGMLVAVWWVPRSGDGPPVLLLAAAFLLFRLFDIAKPFPIGPSQRLPGGFGVVADDLLAGVATNAALRVLHAAGVPL